MRRFIGRILHGRPTEASRLIAKANAFPRHTPTSITYQGLTLKVTDMLSVAWQIKEFFEDERMKFRAEGPTPVIIDCGANVGVSVLYQLRTYPDARIICFEPDEAVVACLKENLRTDRASGVEVRPEAVWVHDQGVSFGREGSDGGSIMRERNAVNIPSVRLKSVLQEFDAIDLLKIDIEGAETEVMLDCGEELKRVRNLYVEYHSFPGKPQELHKLLELLARCGFRYYIHRIGVHHAHPFTDIEAGEMDMQLDIHAVRE